jgi:hypothetical protein
MKSREEILEELKCKASDYGGEEYVMEGTTLTAMSEYAREVAVGLERWKTSKGMARRWDGYCWYLNKWISPSELFDIFINENKKG